MNNTTKKNKQHSGRSHTKEDVDVWWDIPTYWKDLSYDKKCEYYWKFEYDSQGNRVLPQPDIKGSSKRGK